MNNRTKKLMILLFLSLFSINLLAAEETFQSLAPSTAFSTNPSENYTLIVTDALNLIRRPIAELTDTERMSKLFEFETLLKLNCLDNYSANVAEVTTALQGGKTYIITCYKGSDVDTAREYILESNSSGELVGFSNGMIRRGSGVGHQLTAKIVFKEAVAAVGSVLVAKIAANKVYPGKEDGDKATHAMYSAAMSSVLSTIAYHFFRWSKSSSLKFGFLGCALIGGAKEIKDKYSKGHSSDADDFGADVIGCASGIISISMTL